MKEWKDIKDEEPQYGQNVIACGTWQGEISGRGEGEYMGIGTWNGNYVAIDCDTYSTDIIEVTHWMPIPAHPVT